MSGNNDRGTTALAVVFLIVMFPIGLVLGAFYAMWYFIREWWQSY